jgi:hypothetical protein
VVENATVGVMHYRDEGGADAQVWKLGCLLSWWGNKLFGLNQDTTAALVNFLKLFWNKGLCRYQC